MGSSSSSSFVNNLPKDFPKDVTFFHFANLGNTCFINSVLQNLLSSQELTIYFENFVKKHSFFKEIIFTNKSILNSPFCCLMSIFTNKLKYQKLLKDAQNSGQINSNIQREFNIQPTNFVDAIYNETQQFVRGIENDSHEFLIYLLTSFDNTINQINSFLPQVSSEQPIEPLPLFSSLFEGIKTTSLECANCHHIKETSGVFSYLYVGIPNNKNDLDLQNLLIESVAPDNIGDDGDGFVCNGCNQKGVKADILSYIKKLPKILLIQLQRFKYSRLTNRMEKKNDFVRFQNRIYVNSGEGPQWYHLKSIICHSGSSIDHGHFVALLRIPKVSSAVEDNGNAGEGGDYWIFASDTLIKLYTENEMLMLVRGNQLQKIPSYSPYVFLYEIDTNKD